MRVPCCYRFNSCVSRIVFHQLMRVPHCFPTHACPASLFSFLLRQTQGTIRTEVPNWQPWLAFFLRSLGEQVRRLEKKVEREKIVLAAMPELQLQIVEFAREHGRVTIGEAIKLSGASRNTLKQHFRVLVERGTLDQHGSGRGVWYSLR
jgi:Fic family protein